MKTKKITFKDEHEKLCYQFTILQRPANDLYYTIMDSLEEKFEQHLNNKYKTRFSKNRQGKKQDENKMEVERKKFKQKKERYQKINKEFLDSFDFMKGSFYDKKEEDVDKIHNFIQELTEK